MTGNIEKFYEKDWTVKRFECDLNSTLKVSSLLRQVEQISHEHSNIVGIDAAHHSRLHTAFLMTRVSVEIHQTIAEEQKIKLVTRPYAPVRASYHRYNEAYDENGGLLATVDSRWILIDTTSRRITRRAPEGFDYPFLESPPKKHDSMEILPCETQPCGSFLAAYSRVDLNGHLNNAEYADVVCDMVENIKDRRIRKMVIVYHNELRLGETMNLHRGEIENGYYCFGGRDTVKCFEANILFEK